MSDTLPNPASDATTIFEAAPDPDGTLIPIPSEAPQGKAIRNEARITVSPRRDNGYYVSIYNGPTEPASEVDDFILDILSDVGMEKIEDLLLQGTGEFLSFLGAVAGVVASVLTTSPILNEYYARGVMDDGIPVTYVVLTPKDD